jgi:glucosamine kinase
VRANGDPLGQGSAGPSALLHGVPQAWHAINGAIALAWSDAGLAAPAPSSVGLGLGLAGVHNPLWAAVFLQAAPVYGAIALSTDGHTTLLGAHGGRPGAVVAIGTGSVGEVMTADGLRRAVGGWGYPAGDEAGGAWIGLRAINHIEQVIDGRAAPNPFAAAVIAACGGGRDAIQAWLAGASQTTYASLARLVLEYGPSQPVAHAILTEAGQQVALIAAALDRDGALPVALCGGLAAPLRPWLPASLLARVVPAEGDSASGALRLLRQQMADPLSASAMPSRRPSPLPSSLPC